MAQPTNAQKAETYREIVGLFLRSERLPVESRIKFRTLSEFFASAESAEPGDLWGSPFAVRIRNEISPALGEGVDSAVEIAQRFDKLGGLLISHRRGRPVEDSFVTLNLQTFAVVLRKVMEIE